jgi:hypothetical protein
VTSKGAAAIAITVVGAVLLAATVFIVGVWASGKVETVKIYEFEKVDCAVVSRGANVSIDCWVKETE